MYVTRDKFDVRTLDGTIAFLRSMYNFKTVVADADKKWDPAQEQLCATLFRTAAKVPVWSKQSGSSMPAGGSASAAMPFIANTTTL